MPLIISVKAVNILPDILSRVLHSKRHIVALALGGKELQITLKTPSVLINVQNAVWPFVI